MEPGTVLVSLICFIAVSGMLCIIMSMIYDNPTETVSTTKEFPEMDYSISHDLFDKDV
jgi:hypothetical protein